MRGLDAARILELSERGAALPPTRRAAMLLAAVLPEAGEDRLLRLPLGVRDRLLMRLRAALFGETLTARQRCGRCAEDFELALTAGQIGLGPQPQDDDLPEAPSGTMVHRRRRYRVRAVSVADMIAAEAAAGPAAARALLARRAAPDAPPDALAGKRLAETLEALDPLADVSIRIACPHCGEGHELRFDAATFVWDELTARAPRILREVADLARAYHWSERDILTMPAARRAFYLAAAAA